MNSHILRLSIISLLFTFVLIGCSSNSEQKVLDKVHNTAQTVFHEDSIESNNELQQFSLYLPRTHRIIEETRSNLILEEGDQTYILFYNALEDSTSELNYEAAATSSEGYELLESFEDENRFGYVRVLPLETDEKDYELQIGVGGVKITTHTNINKLVKDTKVMMQMANSIAYNAQD